jgi:ABC-type multidrug transport system fused ATPase/permease subunit
MKENIRLKTLISISLLIFILPFLQTCSDKSLKNLPAYKSEFTGFVEDSINRKIEYNKETKINDTIREFIEVTKIEKQKIIAKNRIEKEDWLKKTKKEYTYNAYFLGFGNYKEFEIRFFADKTFYIMLNFTLIIVFTFIMIIISFKKKFKQIIIMSTLNLVFLFVATFSLYLFDQIEEIKQIKFGYYLFVLNSILIIIESRNEYKKMKT